MGQAHGRTRVLLRRVLSENQGGPVGCLRRSELDDVVEWMKKNEGSFHFIMIMRAAGSPVGLPDREV